MTDYILLAAIFVAGIGAGIAIIAITELAAIERRARRRARDLG